MKESVGLARRLLHVIDVITKFAEQGMPDDLAQLSINQARTLYLLLHQPGISQKDLADRLQVTPPAVSVTVRDMEASGWIERQPDPEDARQIKLALTKRGQEFILKGEKMRYNAVAQMLDVLPLKEQRAVVGALERAFEISQNGNGSH
jgi:DNA-binding MarR family transcriptional regulator